MLNKHPLWKDLLVVAFAIFGLIYALPNLYPDDPALQITGAKPGVETRQEILDKATSALSQAGITIKQAELEEKSGLVRFTSVDDQLKAIGEVKKALQAAHPDQFVVALNLAPTTPAWLMALGASPMKLGLDLRGGVHFLMEVDMDKALDIRIGNTVNSMRDRFRDDRVRAKTLRQVQGQPAIEIVFSNVDMLDKGRAILRKDFREFQVAERPDGTDLPGRGGVPRHAGADQRRRQRQRTDRHLGRGRDPRPRRRRSTVRRGRRRLAARRIRQ